MKVSLDQLVGLTDSHLESCQVAGVNLRLHPQVVSPLTALTQAAKQQGFDLTVASAFRDYHRQALIWNGKFSGERPILDHNSQPLDPRNLTELDKIHAIMRWSALPGASRHHWGCDLDVYAKNCLPTGIKLQLEPWEYQTGHQQEFSDWLQQYMQQYGFYLPYQQDLGGVAIEPWHISYAEVADITLTQLNLDSLRRTWHQHPFLGQQTVLDQLEVLYTRYISNITTSH